MVLWGTASGAEPADAARAQLEGVLTALADLAPEQRLKRITIVSRDAGRLGAARRVAEDLLRLHPAAPLLRIARERKSARKPARPLKPTATPLAWLFVQESAGQMLRVALLGTAPKATALTLPAAGSTCACSSANTPASCPACRSPTSRSSASGSRACCCRPRSPRPCPP